jgi:hypothetical protein
VRRFISWFSLSWPRGGAEAPLLVAFGKGQALLYVLFEVLSDLRFGYPFSRHFSATEEATSSAVCLLGAAKIARRSPASS